MMEEQKRPSSARSTTAATTEVKKDPFKYVPDVVNEMNREGTSVVNQYKRGLVLGKGGFAQVYLTQQTPSNQRVALKIVAKSSLIKARAKQKLQTEIRIHRALDHENVVRFLRFFEDSDFAYLVLELCGNNSMSELMNHRKRVTEPEVRYYMSQLVGSLQYLHLKLVIHRDLKLGNIFLDNNMRLKVGDFGLAARLEHEHQRRMTVCGTPNYIAPELLEGKNGHSFEVDIWSTGVIMYTLLIGKPPFQSKDVKSTYKRILANQYAFPDDILVSAEAKDLVATMLQTPPEARPSLVQILNHAFFTAPGAFTPVSLPESSLKTAPLFAQHMPVVKSDIKGSLPQSHNDENDPNAMNRLPTKDRLFAGEKEFGTAHASARSAEREKDREALLKKRPESAQSDSTRSAVPLSSAASSTTAQLYARQQVLSAQSTSISSVNSMDKTAGSSITSTAQAAASSITQSGTARMRIASSMSTRTTSSLLLQHQKDQQQQQQQQQQPLTQQSTSAPWTRSMAASATASSALASKQSSTLVKDSKFDIFTDNKERDGHAYQGEFQRVQQGMQQMRIDQRENAMQNCNTVPVISMTASEASPMTGSTKEDRWTNSTEKIQPKAKRAKEAWTPTTALEVPSSSHGQALGAYSSSLGGSAALTVHQQQHRPSMLSPPTKSAAVDSLAQGSVTTLATARTVESQCMGTPTDNLIPSNNHNAEVVGTLEKMHEMLNDNSFSFGDHGNVRLAPPALNLNAMTNTATTNCTPFSKIWVVRYVDYTSKYGLGFLFNTGSAGVYFNDSTKIVLSPDGKIFQYIERKKRDNSLVTSNTNSNNDHTITKYRIDSFPTELQKKVTLLKHFREYLLNQEKSTVDGEQQQAHGFGGNGVEDCGGGFNKQMSTWQEQEPVTLEDDSTMPFLKKWIRTKHAILFRLSNRTVQVVFYDKSEVLLSSEARQITYVSKTGERSEHMLDDVMVSGRSDIAKRLKYTKDIMHRLINNK